MKIRIPKFTIMRMFFVVIIIPTAMVFVTVATMHHDPRQYKVTEEVYMEVESDGRPLGRMVFGLFGEAVPRTVKNFVTFATRGYNGHTYRGTVFHRVIKKFMVQGGDVISGDGKGSISIYGKSFPDERLDIKHAGPGFLSMANNGKDTNGCQFFITRIATPWLNGHHVVFGKLVEGESVMKEIEYVATDWNDRPLKDIIITNSGRRAVKDTYVITDDPYNLLDWLKTISVPLMFSFCIVLVFNQFIKKLDRVILEDDGSMDNEEAARKKREERLEEEKRMLLEEEEKKEEEEKEEGKKKKEEKEEEEEVIEEMGKKKEEDNMEVRKRVGKASE